MTRLGVCACLATLATPGCRIGFDPISGAADSGTDAVDGTTVTPWCEVHMFCDGFEEPGFGKWTRVDTVGSSAVEQVAGGARGSAVRATSPMGTNIAALVVDTFPSSPPADQWVTVYVRAGASTTLNVEPVMMSDPARVGEIVFSLYDDGVDIHAHNMAGDFLVQDLTPPPRDQWMCMELHIAISPNGVVELYRDGALLLASGPLDTRPSGGDLSRLGVGIVSKPVSVDEVLEIDEVAADTTRVGCF